MKGATIGLWALQAVGNLALFGLLYWWLGIGDQKALQLLTTVFLGFVIVFFTLWLQAGTFAWFREPQLGSIGGAFRRALRTMLAFAAVCLLAWLLYVVANRIYGVSLDVATKIASFLTLKTRKPIKPMTFIVAFRWIYQFIRWVFLPAMLLPLAAEVSAAGWSAFRGRALAISARPVYWAQCLVLLLAALYLPDRLIHWTPSLKGVALQTVSFTARFGLAYLLFVTAWVLLVWLSSGGKPRVTQPVTAGTPNRFTADATSA